MSSPRARGCQSSSSPSRIHDKLRESIRREGPDSGYLGWVLNESLRLVPPVNIGCLRTVRHDIELPSGHLLPKGTLLMTCCYAVHRLKKYWGEDAEEFRPERWADTSRHHPCQFIAFGAGPRGCPGREFALFHMRALFAALLTRYKFQGKPRADAFKFDSPLLVSIIACSPTVVTIELLE